ncbi:MAG: hypothetical protein ABIG37_00285 [Nanoarchaeota archaeon]
MNFLEKIVKRRKESSKKKFEPYKELHSVGIPIEKRREIVEDVYSPLGRIVLKPMVLKMALKDIRENNLPGEDAENLIRSYLNLPYTSQTQPNVLES